MTGMEDAGMSHIGPKTAHGDAFDTSPERVHETPDREHVGMEHAIEQVAREALGEDWLNDTCREVVSRLPRDDSGLIVSDVPAFEVADIAVRIARESARHTLADAGLLAPTPLREVQAEAWDEGYGEPRECCGMCPKNACPWDNGGAGPTNPYREPVDRAEGDGRADQ